MMGRTKAAVGSSVSEVVLIFPDKAAAREGRAGVWSSLFKFVSAAGVGPAESGGHDRQVRSGFRGHSGQRRGDEWRQWSSNLSRRPAKMEGHQVSFLFGGYGVK